MYENNWESLNKRPVPEWFSDAKFGIFIHWGLYSVPAYAPKKDYAEWYGYSCNLEKCETEAQEKYKAGEGIMLDIIDAQEALSTARQNYISAQYDYARYKAALEADMGGTNEPAPIDN